MLETFRKLLDLLDARERRHALLLFTMILFVGLLEAAGATSILPFMSVLANPEIVQTNKYLAALHEFLGSPNKNSFLFFLAAIIFVIVATRVSFAAATQYAIARFYSMRNFSISSRLLGQYLRQPYAWFLGRHSADLGRNVLSEVDHVVNGSLKPALELVSNTIVSLCFVVLIVVVEPVIAAVALFVLGGAYGAVYLCVQKYLRWIGTDRVLANQERFQIAQDILGGIKEVKVSGSEDVSLKRFRRPASRYHRRQAASNITNQLPRFFFEAFTIGGMLVVVMVLLVRANDDLSKVLPILGLYAFTGMRLLPNLQRIYRDSAKIAFGRDALRRLHADLAGSFNPDPTLCAHNVAPLTLRNNITLRKITYTYPASSRPVLSDLTLTIPARTTVGFVGTTGSGKTTVMDLILGLLRPENGEMRVDDVPITTNNIRAWQRAIGYVPQQIFLSDDTVAGNIAFGVPLEKIDQHAVERAARFAELHGFITEQLPRGYETRVGEGGVRLSGGQRQRLGIARALYNNPEVLAMDEATSALDNVTEQAIIEALHNLAHKKTILIIAHRFSTVRACDRIFLLENGHIKASGAYDELFASDKKFRQLASVS